MSLAKWLSICLQTKWLRVRVPLQLIKNGTCYYFDDMIDLDFDNILLDEKSYEK